MGSELGIGYDSVGHAGYVDHWVQILTDTPKEILYAAADAERISDYILTIEQKKEIKHTQEVGLLEGECPNHPINDAGVQKKARRGISEDRWLDM
jgi:hypothetical protein